jgi:branched-subunit amino acid ABC-type transport system permease component
MLCQSVAACGNGALVLLLLGLTQGAPIALNAVALTLVYGATRTLNLAHGDLAGLASALIVSITFSLLPPAAISGFAAVLVLLASFTVGVAGGSLLGLVVERAAIRPFRGRPLLVPLIATVGLPFIFYQFALFWRTPRNVPPLLPLWRV